ncbi:chemotaxis protein CheB [Paraburkholderia strydomiana]|jgi:two-component system chemotaxis response regulator CheB|uniref:protein-glutamate methylesterase n=1 Tax=Paraburkholderia strydomiana TaxID=1245417 RepID=A0ABW9ELW3_9BURK
MDSFLTARTVAIGASGSEGFTDLKDLLAIWPPAMNAVIVAVLHRPSDRQSFLREVLQRTSRVPVVVAENGDRLCRGVCYIGKPDQPITVGPGRHALLLDGKGDRFRNRTIDLLFRSVAHDARAAAVGVVLSGALDDGSRGLAAIREAGGITMVLDPHDKPRGMQRNAIDYDGPISFVGNLPALAWALSRLTMTDNATG